MIFYNENKRNIKFFKFFIIEFINKNLKNNIQFLYFHLMSDKMHFILLLSLLLI